jgi:hypothetical protein
LAARILPLLSSDSSGDAKLNAVLKSYNLKFSHTGLVNRVNKYLPGLGEVKGLLDDAFSASAPISKQAKVYNSNSWFVVATVSETKEASMSELSKERDRYRQNVLYRKERGIVDELMQGLQKTAKIEKNEQAISGASGG